MFTLVFKKRLVVNRNILSNDDLFNCLYTYMVFHLVLYTVHLVVYYTYKGGNRLFFVTKDELQSLKIGLSKQTRQAIVKCCFPQHLIRTCHCLPSYLFRFPLFIRLIY